MTAEKNIETNKRNLRRAAKWIGIPLAGLFIISLFVDSPEPKPATEPQPVVQTVEPTVEPAPTPEIAETPTPTETPTPVVEESVYYDSCDDVRAAGAAPIHRGEPGYGDHLDRDGDGSACEVAS